MGSHREARELNSAGKSEKLRKEARLKLQDLSGHEAFKTSALADWKQSGHPPTATLLKIAKGLKVGIHIQVSTGSTKAEAVVLNSN